jgi:ankyrin repeat protein
VTIQDQTIEAVVPSLTEMGLLTKEQPSLSTNTYHEDNDGNTTLHLAAQSDPSNCIYSLLKNSTNVDVNIQDNNGRTRFHLAAQLDSSNCIYSLLRNSTNVDVNIQDKDGHTSFQAAAFLGWEDLVLEYLEYGADPFNIKRWWQSRQDPSIVKEIPGYLKL